MRSTDPKEESRQDEHDMHVFFSFNSVDTAMHVKNKIPLADRCCAKRADGDQCTRRKRTDSDTYCGDFGALLCCYNKYSCWLEMQNFHLLHDMSAIDFLIHESFSAQSISTLHAVFAYNTLEAQGWTCEDLDEMVFQSQNVNAESADMNQWIEARETLESVLWGLPN